jgi:hypothetical protein
VTEYSGAERAAAQKIFVSETLSRGVVAVETDKEESEDLLPLLQRLAGGHESVAVEPSVRWCLGEAVTEAPVVTGEVNGSRYPSAGKGRSERSVERLEPFDTLMTSLDASRSTGTVKHEISRVDEAAPESGDLETSFGVGVGDVEYGLSPVGVDDRRDLVSKGRPLVIRGYEGTINDGE